MPVDKNGEEKKEDDNVFSSTLPSEVSEEYLCVSVFMPEPAILLLLMSDLASVSLFLGPG